MKVCELLGDRDATVAFAEGQKCFCFLGKKIFVISQASYFELYAFYYGELKFIMLQKGKINLNGINKNEKT